MTKHPLPFQVSTLTLCILSALSPSPQATEATIKAAAGVSLALRNDGVLFQFGGTPFTPAPLDESVPIPVQPEAVILTKVSSLASSQLQEEYGNSSTLDEYGHSSTLAYESVEFPEGGIGRALVGNTLLTWTNQPGDMTNPQPTPVLSDFQKMVKGEWGTEFILTNTGNVFSLRRNTPVPLPGLADIRKIVGGDYYLALTYAGIVFRGRWEEWTQQFTPAEPVSGLSDVVDIAFGGGNEFLALTRSGQVYWQGWDWNTNSLIPIEMISSRVAGVTKIFTGKNRLALTHNGEVYNWDWDWNTRRLTSPKWIISGISDVVVEADIFNNNNYFSTTHGGQLYTLGWQQNGVTNSFGATLVKQVSKVKKIISYGYGYIAITTQGDVYLLGNWDWSTNSPTVVTQVIGISHVTQIRPYQKVDGWTSTSAFLALTEEGKVYTWEWNPEPTTPIATQVSDWSDVIAIAVGGWANPHFLALRKDGRLCGWGDNSSGQLGLTPSSPVSTPVCGIEDLIVMTPDNSYPLHITKVGNGSVTASVGPLDCGETCTASYLAGNQITLIATPQTGSQFQGWSSGCQGTGPQTLVTLKAPTDCTATFESVPPRTLTLQKSGEGTGTITGTDLDCGSDCSSLYPNYSPVTLTVVPAANSQFIGWQSCADHFTITQDTVCTALFAPRPTHTLTLTKVGEGRVISTPAGLDCGNTCRAEFLAGSTVTLKATSAPGASFGGWGGDCYGNNPQSITLERDLTCTVTFESGGTPNINLWPTQVDFAAPPNSSQVTQTISIYNGWWSQPLAGLQIGTLNLSNQDAFILNDTCSNTEIAPWHSCNFDVKFRPPSAEANLWIPSNDPDMATATLTLTGRVCSAASDAPRWVSIYPPLIDFGAQLVGEATTLTQSVSTWSYGGCGNLQIEDITFTGAQAREFSFKDKQCYYGVWEAFAYSYCQFALVFSPTAEGRKEANVTFTFNDPTLNPISLPIRAKASFSKPLIEVTPPTVNFGQVTLDKSASQQVTITNTGEVNLKLDNIFVNDNQSFRIEAWSCQHYNPGLAPGEVCQLTTYFTPFTFSFRNKTGTLMISSNAANHPALEIPLQGTTQVPADCTDDNITIESINDGAWETPSTWNRRAPPTENDVVRIRHTVTALPYTSVKTLCMEPEAILESQDNQGTPLSIYVTDYLENKGTIRGKDGQAEIAGASSCTDSWTVGSPTCAQNGASISLQVGNYYWWHEDSTQNGLIINEGNILAGNGGSGRQYGGHGGQISINGKGVLNLPVDDESGVMQAGQGGDLTGTEAGQAGRGGDAWVSGYERVSGNGGRLVAGNGGNCNPNATVGQIGGNGGSQRWWGATVDLSGTFLMGKGGTQCTPLGSDGREGFFRTDPSVISLSGVNTKVRGGNVTIFGGNNWTLNLSNLNRIVVQASGDITLAVGEGGIIDLRGNTQPILEAKGQVNLLSNTLLLDEGRKLSEIFMASNIVVGPSKILHDVSIIGSKKVLGRPGMTVPVVLTLSNSGPEQDTYRLELTNSGGWSQTPLPSTMTVAGLATVQLVINVTLPMNRGALEVIRVNATSMVDPKVSSKTEIHVGVATKDSYVMLPPLPQGETSPLPNPVPTPPTPGSITATPCPSTGVINSVCNNRGGVIRDATFETQAKVAGGDLEGTIDNRGFVAQVTIQPGTELHGGTLSGYIVNQGTLADFQFVGAAITGGLLAGTVTNESKVGGTFIDVTLAPNTHLSGGKLQGEIRGDKTAPALLEDLRIIAGSRLSGVTLGNNVIVEEGVIFEDDTLPTSQLPSLGETLATNNQGQTIKTASNFRGGVAVKETKTFQTSSEVKIVSDTIAIQGQITVDPIHIDQVADLVVYLSYQLTPEDKLIYLMVNNTQEILAWDEQLASLIPFQEQVTLTPEVTVPIYQGPLLLPGIVKLHFGYRLADGTVVSHSKPIELNVTE